MKITSVEEQKKNNNRLNLFIDGVFHTGLDVGTAARLGLYQGKEVTPTEVSNIDLEDEYQKCMNSALALASRRMQSELEFWQKLGKKYDKAVIGRCLDRLRVLGYASDTVFADLWIRERSRTRGHRLLEVELKQKGIDKGIYQPLLEEMNSEYLFQSAIIQARRKFNPNSSKAVNFDKVTSLLSRRGYNYSVAKEALNYLYSEIDKATD